MSQTKDRSIVDRGSWLPLGSCGGEERLQRPFGIIARTEPGQRLFNELV